MLFWLVDNANTVYVVLGLIVLGLGVAWWLNRRTRMLVAAGAFLGLMALVWLLSLIVVTDRQQVQANIWAMRQAILDGKPDDLARHWSKDFNFQNQTADTLAKAITKAAATYRVNDIHLWDFDVRSLADDKAEIWFRCRAGREGETPFPALCKAVFVKEGERWKLQRLTFHPPIANTDQEIRLPI